MRTPHRLASAMLALTLTVATAAPAMAHTEAEVLEEVDELVTEFVRRILDELNGGITLTLLKWFRSELEAIEALYTPPTTKRPSSRSLTIGEAAEAWRSLVAAYFPADQVDYALAVLWCESKGNPNAANPTSSARGLFQHLERYWPARSSSAGWAGYSIFDPTANVAVAAWLSADGTGWHHWTCRP